MKVIDETKRFLTEDRFRIKLHDLVSAQLKEATARTTAEQFPRGGSWSNEEFIDRLRRYEDITSNLVRIQALIAYWGTNVHRDLLTLALRRICGELRPEGGLVAWTSLRWYPALLLLYAGGIAAVAASRYAHLRQILGVSIHPPDHLRARTTLIRGVHAGVRDIDSGFKLLPGHENNLTPRSEYLLALLRQPLDDLFLLGSDYEDYFDRFEVLSEIQCAHEQAAESGGQIWGPFGRFAWKFRMGDQSSPLHIVIAEADASGDTWEPLTAGLFQGSLQRFKDIAGAFSKRISERGW